MYRLHRTRSTPINGRSDVEQYMRNHAAKAAREWRRAKQQEKSYKATLDLVHARAQYYAFALAAERVYFEESLKEIAA